MKENVVQTLSIVFLILIANSSLILAQEQQEIKLKLNFTAVSELITVQNFFNQTEIIPNYEYKSMIDVNWSIPNNAVKGLTAEKVVVFANTKINENVTGIYFKQIEQQASEVYFILSCEVSNSGCNSSSVLTRNIPFYVKINDTSIDLTDLDIFEIKASLTPFGEYEYLVNETQIFYKILEELRNATTSLSQNDEITGNIMNQLDSVENKLDIYDTVNVSSELNEVNETIIKLDESKQLLEKINQLEKIITELKINLTSAQDPSRTATIEELEKALEKARNLTTSLEIESAVMEISEVERNIENLNEQQTFQLPEVDLSKVNPYYVAILVAAALVVAVIIAVLRRKK